jgi:hypothetical protein
MPLPRSAIIEPRYLAFATYRIIALCRCSSGHFSVLPCLNNATLSLSRALQLRDKPCLCRAWCYYAMPQRCITSPCLSNSAHCSTLPSPCRTTLCLGKSALCHAAAMPLPCQSFATRCDPLRYTAIAALFCDPPCISNATLRYALAEPCHSETRHATALHYIAVPLLNRSLLLAARPLSC